MAADKKAPLTPVAKYIMEKRYLARDEHGEIVETPAQLFSRVASAVAEADRIFAPGASVCDTSDRFEEALSSLSFLPNTPCLVNAGRPIGQLAACFVLPLDDSLESIFQTLKDAAVIHRSGGGTGFSFSSIRPRGDTIFPAFGVSEGPVSFIRLFDAATYIIDRNQVRPGANMGVLHASHPDIEEFVRAKTDLNGLQNFNLSVALDDRFIECLEKGRDYPLVHPRSGRVGKSLHAGRLLEIMAECAWQSGDPGLLFIDRINRANPLPDLGFIEATNPCGEQPLLPYESCTLGSVNLVNFVEEGGINYEKLKKQVSDAVHFLDNVVEINRYPLSRTAEASRAGRRIGIGVMGFADALILLGVSYQSDEALRTAEEVMSCISGSAAEASAKLAEKRGNFPSFDSSIYPGSGVKYRRNASLTTIAPTGSISLIAGVSSGIEPVFAFCSRRRVIDKEFDYVHPVYKQRLDAGKPASRDIFMTARDVPPEWHLKIQSAFQKYTDNAVSKTVNFPADADAGDIEELFRKAVRAPVKGITAYRDTSSRDQAVFPDPGPCYRLGCRA